jgi:Helix-turn-helix of DDE superfamily endonuclease
LRYHRISQMQELVWRVQGALTEPWQKETGRRKSCGMYEAVEIACMYLRQNATQEFLGDLRYVSQSTVSRIVTRLMPVVKAVLEEFVPLAADAIEMVNGRVCLVDGTITPCWSYGRGPSPDPTVRRSVVPAAVAAREQLGDRHVGAAGGRAPPVRVGGAAVAGGAGLRRQCRAR